MTVASDLSILTQLIPGRTVYWIGHTGEPAPDYVVIDRRISWGGNPPTNAAQYAADRYGHSTLSTRPSARLILCVAQINPRTT